MKTNNEGTEEETEMTTAMAITECSVYIVHTQALKEYAELWQNVLTQRKMNLSVTKIAPLLKAQRQRLY